MSNHIAHGCRNFKAQTGTNLILIVTIGRVLNFVKAGKGFDLVLQAGFEFYKFSAAFILVTRQDRRCSVYGLEHEGQVDPPRWSVFVKTGKKETVQCSEDIDFAVSSCHGIGRRFCALFWPFSFFQLSLLGVAWCS